MEEPDVSEHIAGDASSFRSRSRTVAGTSTAVHPTLPAPDGHQVGTAQASGGLRTTLYSPITDSGCEVEEEDCVILGEHNEDVDRGVCSGETGEIDF